MPDPKSSPLTHRLGTAPVGGLLWRLGLPGMFSMFIMALYNVINTFWVAKLGPGAIAATTVVAPYQIVLLAVGVGSGAGFSSLLSRRFGEQQTEAANRIAAQVFFLALGFGACFWAATTFATRPLLTAFGSTPDIFPLAEGYLDLIGYGAAFSLFSMMANNILRGSGNTLLPMYFMLLGAGLNLLLDPFLIYGWLGFPAWGVKGAALATVIAQGVSALANGAYLLSRRSGYTLRWEYMHPRWADLREIYRVGLPSFIMQTAAGLLLIGFNQVLAGFGSAMIAVNGLIFRTTGLLMMPIAGISQGLMPVVGYNWGAGHRPRLWRAVKLATFGSALFATGGAALLQLFPHLWVGAFSQDPEFFQAAVPALRIATLAIPLVGPQLIWITTLQALGQGRSAMWLSLIRQALLLSLLGVLPAWLGASGVWVSVPAADTLAFLISGWWVLAEHRRQRPRLTAPPPAVSPGTTVDWVD